MEPQTASTFRKLKHNTYLVLEVLMFVDYQDALNLCLISSWNQGLLLNRISLLYKMDLLMMA
jgi:hypothetical protein